MRHLLSKLYFKPVPLVLALLSLGVLGGCLPTEYRNAMPLADVGPVGHNTPRLTCFLNLQDNEGPGVRMEVASVEVLADGLWLPITRGPLTIDTEKIGGGQLFVGALALPQGSYRRMRFTVTQGSIRQADGKYTIVTREPFSMVVNFTGALNLAEEDSRCLFITWDVLKSIETDNVLNPVLTVAPSARPLLVNLVYVACPDIDTIFVVAADKNWVVDSFGLKGGPTYLAIDPLSPRQRLYVLSARERLIKVVDLSSYRVVNYFPIPLNDAPTFMTISPDGEGAFLLDERSGYLSRMDLSTGQSVARVLLGYRPQYAIYLDSQNQLAVSLSLSQKVLLLNPLSLAVEGTISTGNSPQGLLVLDNRLYVADSGEDAVSTVDLASRGDQDRLNVGFDPRRLIGVDNRIYVSNFKDGSLSVLIPGQLGVIQEIQGLGHPLEMAFNQAYRRLYVTDEESGALSVVDVNSNLLLGRIVLGARPLGMDTIQ
jgi:DNA-binding beta-propeller fold protein YncE